MGQIYKVRVLAGWYMLAWVASHTPMLCYQARITGYIYALIFSCNYKGFKAFTLLCRFGVGN